MRIFRVGQTQLQKLRCVLNGSRRYYIVLALAGALILSPTMLHTKAQTMGFTSNGIYSIRSKSSGRLLDIDYSWGGQADGQKLIQWDSLNGLNQQFKIVDVGDDYYTIQALHSNKLLDVEGGSRADAAALQQYRENGGDNQRFQIVQVDCYYRIKAKHSQKVLDARGTGANGSPILQYAEVPGSDSQLFTFIRLR